MKTTVEYRVRKVTRYIVTRHFAGEHTGGIETKGEYDNEEVAREVAYALCKAEHDLSGEPIDSTSFIYPDALLGAPGTATLCG